MDLNGLLSQITGVELILVPLIIAVIQVAKEAGLPKKLVPFATLGLGVAFSFLIDLHWLGGLMLGLSAMGAWSSGKAVAGQ